MVDDDAATTPPPAPPGAADGAATSGDPHEPSSELPLEDDTTTSPPESEFLTPEERTDLIEAEDESPPVSYSGQDFDVAGLVNRLRREDILVPTFGHNDSRISSAGFQRSFVWSRPQMDRFIESLLLGYPIPGIFLIRQADRRYLVLDGQQRLKTLQHFYDGVHDGQEFALRNVAQPLKGLTYRTLGDEQRRLIDDAFIQATIVASDGTDESLDSIYKIFERLNAGGTQLTPHEIRVALFAGPFVDFLEELNSDSTWRHLYGKRSPRLRDQELVLRVLALYFNAASYRRPLKTFLNDFLRVNRDLTTLRPEEVKKRFQLAALLIASGPGREGVRYQSAQINAALTEAVMVGLLRRLDQGTAPAQADVASTIEKLKGDGYLQESITRSTADEENVRSRLELATAAFATI